MTVLERYHRRRLRKLSFSKRPLNKRSKRAGSNWLWEDRSQRMARAQRSFRQLSAQLWARRRWGMGDARQVPVVVLDAELQQWLEIHLEETVFKEGGKGCITLFQLANELVGHREWLSLYAGLGGGRTSSVEDNILQRKKSMLNVLHDIQNERTSHQTYITNWAEAVAALAPHVEWEETPTEDEADHQQQQQQQYSNDSVRKYVRRLEQINVENRLAASRVLPDARLYLNRCLVVPRNEHDYSEDDALLESQLQGGTTKEEDVGGPQPLTPEQQEEFYDMISAGPEIVAKLGEDTVQRRSLGTLLPGEWLNDEVIHFYLLLLARSGQHFFKSFFMTKLLNVGNAQCDGKYEYRNVKRWSKKVEGM